MIRAIAHEDQMRQVVFIHVLHEWEEEGRTKRLGLHYVGREPNWELVVEGAEAPATFMLSMEIAREVQHALNALFGDPSQTILRMEFREELKGIDDKLAAIQKGQE
jgi:hypothetical protein